MGMLYYQYRIGGISFQNACSGEVMISRHAIELAYHRDPFPTNCRRMIPFMPDVGLVPSSGALIADPIPSQLEM